MHIDPQAQAFRAFVFLLVLLANPAISAGETIKSSLASAKSKISRTPSRTPASAEPDLPNEVALSVRTDRVEVCGKLFTRIHVATRDPRFFVRNDMIRVGKGLTVSLPGGVQVIRDPKAEQDLSVRVESPTDFDLSAAPLVPPLRTGDPAASGACPSIVRYYDRMKRASGKVSTPLFQLSLQKGKGTLRPSRKKMNIHLHRFHSMKEEPHASKAKKTADRKIASIVGATKMLIVYQDIYADVARDLANLRSAKDGFDVETIAVTALPGYQADAATPDECSGNYSRECYHYATDIVPGVSAKAVPSLFGFVRPAKANASYTRVSYIPGLIRAYIRHVKKSNPLAYVVLMGDPEEVPPIFIPKVDDSAMERSTLLLSSQTYGVVDENELNHEYTSGNGRFSLPTDIYYALPDRPLALTGKINYFTPAPYLWPCQDSSGTQRLRDHCDPATETRGWPGMQGYGWPVEFPFTRTFDDPISARNLDAYTHIATKDILAVGRILTQSRFHGGVDPAARNYITKLARWEQNPAPFLDNTLLTSHGEDSVNIDVFTLIKDTLGYGITEYLPNSGVPTTDVFTAAAEKQYFLWSVYGHGGHGGVQGTTNGIAVPNQYGFGMNGVIVSSSDASSNTVSASQFRSHGDLEHGYIFANSCSTANYLVLEDRVALAHPGSNPESLGEYLMGVPRGGAGAGAFMNYFVGWTPSDENYNSYFAGKVRGSWERCEKVGDALRSVLFQISIEYPGYFTHQILNRVWFGDPSATIAAPNERCL